MKKKIQGVRIKRATVLYDQLIRCELKAGAVHIEVGSGEHRNWGALPVAVAMELHHALTRALRTSKSSIACFACEARAKIEMH